MDGKQITKSKIELVDMKIIMKEKRCLFLGDKEKKEEQVAAAHGLAFDCGGKRSIRCGFFPSGMKELGESARAVGE